MNINNVEVAGTPQNRRQFMAGLGLSSLATLAGLKVTGASEGSVGFDSDIFRNHPFGAMGGYVDNKTLILPSGTGVSLGQYGNPLLNPAVLHGVPLENIDPRIVNGAEFEQRIIRQKTAVEPELLRRSISEVRLFQVMVKDGNGYKIWDLSKPSLTPPTISVGLNGELEIREGNRIVVSKNDGYHLKGLYHVDVNRFDKGAMIGIFEAGSAPTEKDPVCVLELDTPLLPSHSNWNNQEQVQLIDPSAIQAVELNGEKFIRSGANVWRYRYQDGVFTAESKAHQGLPDTSWDEMGDLQFYSLSQRGMNTFLLPEPDLGRAFDARTQHWSTREARITGVILFSAKDGAIQTMRTSLTNLKRDGGRIDYNGNELIWTKHGETPRRFTAYELRSKPGVSDVTFDLYAVENASGFQWGTDRKPMIHAFGEFDVLQAYRNAKRALNLSA